MNFENIIFLGFDFTLIELLALAILWVIVLWSIVMIICILKKVFNILKKFWAEIKENEKKLKDIGLNEDEIKKETDKEQEKKNEKEQYEQAIRRILDSESLLIVGKYLTYIIVGFFILLIVAVIGLVLIAKIK